MGSRHAGAGKVQQRCSGAALRVGQRMSGLREAAVQIGRRNMVSPRFFPVQMRGRTQNRLYRSRHAKPSPTFCKTRPGLKLISN